MSALAAVRWHSTREEWAEAVRPYVNHATALPDPGLLTTFAMTCVACGHTAFSGPNGGELEPCSCAEPQDRRIVALLAGHARDMDLASELHS